MKEVLELDSYWPGPGEGGIQNREGSIWYSGFHPQLSAAVSRGHILVPE